jgi:hypothetical protein
MHYQPYDKASSRTVARYPVRSGPKQFASYLGDMGSIILEVLNGPMLLPVGYAEVTSSTKYALCFLLINMT